MDEQRIRSIVQQELAAQSSSARFGLNNTAQHRHTGPDGPQISQNSILPGNRLEGSIAFSQATTYRIGTNFNPVAIQVHGNVIGNNNERFITVGNAQLGGSPFYLQPGTSTSTVVGGPPQNVIQSCTYFGFDSSSFVHTLVNEGHLVDIFYGGAIHARATITSFDKTAIYFDVTTLDSGWTINLSFTIT